MLHEEVRLRTKLLGAMIIALVISTGALWFFEAKAETDFLPGETVESGRIAVVVGSELSDDVSLLQVRRLLEHEGLLYEIIPDTGLSSLKYGRFSAIIVVGSSQPLIEAPDNPLKGAVAGGTGLIWIGGELSNSLSSLLGVASEDQNAVDFQTVKAIKYGDVITQVFNETLYPVMLAGASALGFFVDDLGRSVAPAETLYKKGNSGLTYYFAYDAAEWWFADLSTPWLRAYRISLALKAVLSEHLIVRLAAYPRNLQSVFITRIEDVDPLHNSYDWLSRADSYLDYYSVRSAPLTVGLIPLYVDPSIGLIVSLGDESASSLRNWLSKVFVRGGTIVQHGYTHQFDDQKTGTAPEFFNSDTQTWLSLKEQKDRIDTGANLIYSNLGSIPKGFEAPHYFANNDTYTALSELGFNYVTQNSNTPFFDRYELADGLVNIPETLGYIPLELPANLEEQMMFNMDMLYNMSAPMLFFDHLFDDESLRIGENLLDYAMEKQGVWLTSSWGLADFWLERLSAYKNLSVDVATDGRIDIVLGQSNSAGLTLVFNRQVKIKSLAVNGAECPAYNGNYAVLPVLPNSSNSVVIDLSSARQNANLSLGLFSVVLSVVLSSVYVHREVKRSKLRLKTDGDRD